MIKEKGVIGSRRRGMKSMCGFMVYTANDIKVEDFEESFIRISYRGPDFCLLKIVKEDFGAFIDYQSWA